MLDVNFVLAVTGEGETCVGDYSGSEVGFDLFAVEVFLGTVSGSEVVD